MRLPQLLLATSLLAIAAPAFAVQPDAPYHRVMDPFFAQLDRQCPGRRLEDLSAGDLELIMEGFEEGLSAGQRREIARAARYGCRHTIAGLTCANVATIRVFSRWRMLPQFAQAVCATTWRCADFGDCKQATAP
ncbi:hypothetical protein [Phenylobacterium sp.]|uniref:hypothetical protein n=1 Tax=Phenylobacterium sp. TaxID=1871053 RepID=UPI002DF5B3DE|nr:hypothetical protein [Phenylobacterium sp.]